MSAQAHRPEVLDVEDLRAGYGAVIAVRDVSLTVAAGEVVVLLGSNGAGKTTTLMAISGAIAPRAGRIRLGGDDIAGLPPEDVCRRGLRLVPEGRRIFPRLTVAENLLLGAVGRRDDPDVSEEDRREELLDLFPILRKRLDGPAGGLSGGEQQQLAIARALMSDPQILLLDEPTMGLSPKLATAMLDLVARLRAERSLTILLVEQNVRKALKIADRAYVMRTGTIELAGDASRLLATSDVEETYLGISA
ncbi:MAG: branched-chain amino acid transport system ATP-binding protein [Solirubrobacteraceae bacterium]|nr:branched-chain amino acid transport system ATP-binding protein [Solirubrobacteraceae bacterium]